MEDLTILLVLSFFVVALVYSSVGFGGGSSYLAMMSVMAVPFTLIPSTALLCNIIVVTGGTYIFYKAGKLDLRKSIPFVITSIPLAYLGGQWRISQHTFFILLGVTLTVASILLWFQPQKNNSLQSTRYNTHLFKALIGGGIGFLSGMVGIGGGIFLSPILHLIRWDEAKKISAIASFFILVNSISGLAGQLQKTISIDWLFIGPLLAAVFLGGQIGSRLGAKYFNPRYVKRITAILVFLVGIRILYLHLT